MTPMAMFPVATPSPREPVVVRSTSAVPVSRAVSVVVPAYREAENLPELIRRLDLVRERAALDLELIVVNDESGDGSDAVVSSAARDWVRLETRDRERGLATAVLHGLRLVRSPVVVVMDADLSHPPEAIPGLLRALTNADFVIGSRYVPGGSTDSRWTLWRALNSRVATLLTRPLTNLADPLSGFFALRRDTLLGARPLSPVGYKIGLELLVKCRCTRVVEVPIHFANRTRGRSKLSLAEQARFLRHLGRLLTFKLRHAGS